MHSNHQQRCVLSVSLIFVALFAGFGTAQDELPSKVPLPGNAIQARSTKSKTEEGSDATNSLESSDEVTLPSSRPFDLMQLIDVRRDTIRGTWRLNNGRISASPTANALLEIPFDKAPERYTITARVRRLNGQHTFGIGLVVGGKHLMASFDANGSATALEGVSGKGASYKGQLFKTGQESEIVCRVEGKRVAITFDGKLVIEWSGSVSKTQLGEAARVRGANSLFLWSDNATYEISRLELTPSAVPRLTLGSKPPTGTADEPKADKGPATKEAPDKPVALLPKEIDQHNKEVQVAFMRWASLQPAKSRRNCLGSMAAISNLCLLYKRGVESGDMNAMRREFDGIMRNESIVKGIEEILRESHFDKYTFLVDGKPMTAEEIWNEAYKEWNPK